MPLVVRAQTSRGGVRRPLPHVVELLLDILPQIFIFGHYLTQKARKFTHKLSKAKKHTLFLAGQPL